jgi:hypothetical protein
MRKHPQMPPHLDSKIYELFGLYRRISANRRIKPNSGFAANFDRYKMMQKYAHHSLVALLDEETRVNGEILQASGIAMGYGNTLIRILDQGEKIKSSSDFERFVSSYRKMELLILELGVLRLYLKRAKQAARRSGGRPLPAIFPTVAGRSVLSSSQEENI